MARILLVLGVVMLVALVVTWNAMTPAGHTAFLLKLAEFVGYFAPAIVLGALWGWIKYSRSSWAWATGIFFILTIGLLVNKPELLP